MSLASLHHAWVLALFFSLRVMAQDGGVPDGGLDAGLGDFPVTITPLALEATPLAPFADPIYGTCPDAPPVQVLDGGWHLLPPQRSARIACIMATCEGDRLLRKEKLQTSPPPWWWTTASGVAVTLAGAAFAAGKLWPKP